MRLTRIIILLIVALVAIVDVLLLVMSDEPNRTISATLYLLSREFPAIPFGFGFLCGHVFWPVRAALKLRSRTCMLTL